MLDDDPGLKPDNEMTLSCLLSLLPAMIPFSH